MNPEPVQASVERYRPDPFHELVSPGELVELAQAGLLALTKDVLDIVPQVPAAQGRTPGPAVVVGDAVRPGDAAIARVLQLGQPLARQRTRAAGPERPHE